MDLNLKDRCALVTAASQGLGRACAEALALEGARVAICSRNRGRVNRTANEIAKKAKVEVFGFVCDLKNSEDVGRLVSECREHLGRVDIFVFNHGNLLPGSFSDIGIEEWQEGLNICLWPAIHLSRSLMPEMKKQRWGRIIFISSIFAKEPNPEYVLSSTLRAGLLGFAKCLAHEVAPYRITVNTVLAGYFDTPLVRRLAKDRARLLGKDIREVQEEWAAMLPTRIIPEPLALGHLVGWLSSEKAHNVTSTTVVSDGGLVKGLF